MTRLLISTIRRNTLIHEPSGFLYVLDSETAIALSRSMVIEPPFRAKDPNARGGLRGARGIAFHDGHVAVSNSSIIFIYDRQWQLQNIFTHPACADIHDITFGRDALWVTSAVNDLLLAFTSRGQLGPWIDLRSLTPVVRALNWHRSVVLDPVQISSGAGDFRDPSIRGLWAFDGAHTNSVCELPDGSLLVSLGMVTGRGFYAFARVRQWMIDSHLWGFAARMNRWLSGASGAQKHLRGEMAFLPASSAVIRVEPDGSSRLLLKLTGIDVPSHTLLPLADGNMLYLNTTSGEAIHFSSQDGAIFSRTLIAEEFLRGACQLPDGTLILGDNNSLIHFDILGRRVIRRFPVSEDAGNSVYDIKIMPEDFDLPPDSLAQGLGQVTGFDGQSVLFD